MKYQLIKTALQYQRTIYINSGFDFNLLESYIGVIKNKYFSMGLRELKKQVKILEFSLQNINHYISLNK